MQARFACFFHQVFCCFHILVDVKVAGGVCGGMGDVWWGNQSKGGVGGGLWKLGASPSQANRFEGQWRHGRLKKQRGSGPQSARGGTSEQIPSSSLWVATPSVDLGSWGSWMGGGERWDHHWDLINNGRSGGTHSLLLTRLQVTGNPGERKQLAFLYRT